MPALVETIAVVNKSGKAVSTSKHLVNVFREARAAYQERKAEVVAGRQANHKDGNRAHRALKATVEDDRSVESSQIYSGSRHGSSSRASQERRRSGGSVRSGSTSPNTIYPSSHNCFSQDLVTLPTRSPPPSPGTKRSYTTQDDALALSHRKPVPARRSLTSPDIDMALAYGDLPGDGAVASRTAKPDDELKPLVSKVKRLLEEADCLQYSATAIIASLQKNPEAMAAVALTLAEISNIASKMAPGALVALKSGAPAVFALLAAPEFLIAGGVALGVTVVAFGGYKIIKKIKAKNALEKENARMDEMLEIGVDVDSINNWRRGITDCDETGSVISAGTSVEGEFMTPQAAALSRLDLNSGDDTPSKHDRSSSRASNSKSESSKRSKASSKGSSKGKEKKTSGKKEKKPSPLRLMFH